MYIPACVCVCVCILPSLFLVDSWNRLGSAASGFASLGKIIYLVCVYRSAGGCPAFLSLPLS